MQLNDRKLATVLAALRYWQRMHTKSLVTVLASDEWQKIATGGDKFMPLDQQEIDALCVSLNTGNPAPDAIQALEECRDLLGLSAVRYKICDGGRGNLGETARYHSAMNLANHVLRHKQFIDATPSQKGKK